MIHAILRKALAVLTLGCFPAFIVGCRQEGDVAAANRPKVNVKVEPVHTENVAETLEIPGRIEANPAHVVHILPPLSGRILNLTLTPGQEVRQGQTVALLQSDEVAQARENFEKARIAAQRADRALERGKLLLAHEVMSQADFEELSATDAAAHAEQERTRQRIHELGFPENGTTDVTPITSPISGTVLDVGTASGEMQRSIETSNGIATVANLDTVWVTGDAFEQDLGLVHRREPVDVQFAAYPGEVVHANIAMVGDSLDPNTHSVKVRVVIPNPQHRYKPSMFATLRIARPAQMQLMVPLEAVLHDGDKTEVYVPQRQGKYLARQVITGATHNKQIEILSGLSDGDEVVIQGAAFLREPAGD